MNLDRIPTANIFKDISYSIPQLFFSLLKIPRLKLFVLSN